MGNQTGNFKEFDQYYIQRENVFTAIIDKSEIINILKDYRKEIERFSNENKLIPTIT